MFNNDKDLTDGPLTTQIWSPLFPLTLVLTVLFYNILMMMIIIVIIIVVVKSDIYFVVYI